MDLVFYYSTKVPLCIEIMKTLSTTRLHERMYFVCVDNCSVRGTKKYVTLDTGHEIGRAHV